MGRVLGYSCGPVYPSINDHSDDTHTPHRVSSKSRPTPHTTKIKILLHLFYIIITYIINPTTRYSFPRTHPPFCGVSVNGPTTGHSCTPFLNADPQQRCSDLLQVSARGLWPCDWWGSMLATWILFEKTTGMSQNQQSWCTTIKTTKRFRLFYSFGVAVDVKRVNNIDYARVELLKSDNLNKFLKSFN